MAQRVLVIDDQPALAEIIGQAFRDDGYETDIAYDGRAGLKMLEQHDHDLVVTDILMPEFDGLEMIRSIRKHKIVPKVVAISGGGKFDSRQLLDVACALGADAGMEKPFLPSKLVNLASTLLRTKH
ncbi:Transcriptional regulatory protein WalR [Alphaproteobacteria bacterium SO-S41]|nr:Transcriptional regulatory protein WalR [Alphaproteobacteria bacterium SO-S41]